MDANAATTYVSAAHFNASFAFAFSSRVVILADCNQLNALADASNSTGNVIMENKVVTANKIIPIKSMVGLPPPKPINPRPAIIIH